MTIEQAKKLLKKIEAGIDVTVEDRKLAKEAFDLILKHSIKKPVEE